MLAALPADTPPAIGIAMPAAAPVQLAQAAAATAPVTPGPGVPAPGTAPDDPRTPADMPVRGNIVPGTRATVLNAQDLHFLGDWGGIRTRMTDAGITPTLAYVNQGLANVRGGTEERFDLAGQFTAGLQFNLRKLTGAIPGTVQVTIVRRHGDSFNANSGLNLQVNPLSIQGRGETWRFSSLWYRVGIGKLDVKIGRMFLNEDFNQARCDFVSGYFCLGANTRSFSNEWPTSPVSQWAVRVQYALSPTLVIKTAAYQYNPKNLDMVRNFYVGFKGATGVLLPTELVWSPKLGGGRLPGVYTVGFYHSTADQNDVVLNTRGQIRSIYGGTTLVDHSTWAGYFDGRQQLTPARRDGSHSLSAFVNVTVTSKQSATNDYVAVGGMTYSGALPGRPRDEIGLAFGTAHVNSRVADAAAQYDAVRQNTMAVRGNEYTLEGYYGISIAPGLVFQPDAQWIIDPRGNRSLPNAVLLGFKTSLIL